MATHDQQIEVDNEDKESDSVFLPIELHTPDAIVSRYTNHMVVQHDGRDFFLSFYEVIPPLLVGDEDERKRQAKDLKSIKANCVARIIIPKERMPSFLATLAKNLAQSKETEALLEKARKET